MRAQPHWYVEIFSPEGDRYVVGDEIRFIDVRSMARRLGRGERLRFRPPEYAMPELLKELKRLGAVRIAKR